MKSGKIWEGISYRKQSTYCDTWLSCYSWATTPHLPRRPPRFSKSSWYINKSGDLRIHYWNFPVLTKFSGKLTVTWSSFFDTFIRFCDTFVTIFRHKLAFLLRFENYVKIINDRFSSQCLVIEKLNIGRIFSKIGRINEPKIVASLSSAENCWENTSQRPKNF